MQEICQSGSEGGAKLTFVPTPILAQALAWVVFVFSRESPVGAPGEYPINLKNHARRNADDGVLRPTGLITFTLLSFAS